MTDTNNDKRMTASEAAAVMCFFYPDDTPLRRLLVHHSRQVARRALLVASTHPELRLDTALIETGAMLHDIGICRCDAPGILCTGPEPYIRHGLMGGQMLRSLVGNDLGGQLPRPLTTSDIEPLARICERHTGTGITRRQILSQKLPLPLDGEYEPVTLEEQVVCYADKFYSKSHPERERTVEQTAEALRRFGDDCRQRFLGWAERFER